MNDHSVNYETEDTKYNYTILLGGGVCSAASVLLLNPVATTVIGGYYTYSSLKDGIYIYY
jgi:hypothetical protein